MGRNAFIGGALYSVNPAPAQTAHDLPGLLLAPVRLESARSIPPMIRSVTLRFLWLLALASSAVAHRAEAADPKAGHNGPACGTNDDYFAEQVWPKVAARSCLDCHKAGGDAEDSKLVLRDPARDPAALEHNRAAFLKLALMQKNDQSRLLLKATGGLSHGGEEVLKPVAA